MRVAIEILGTPLIAVEYEKNSAKNPGCPLSADGSCGIEEILDDDDEVTVVSNAGGQFELADLPSDDDEDEDEEDRHACACANAKKQLRRKRKPTAQRFGFCA